MKKIICIVLSLMCLGNCGVFAEDITFRDEGNINFEIQPTGGLYKEAKAVGVTDEDGVGTAGSFLANSGANTVSSLRDTLEEALYSHTEKIDVSGFGYTTATSKDLLNVFCDVVYANPMLMSYTEYVYSYNVSSGAITKIEPRYIFETAAEDELARKEIQAGIKHYTDLIDDDMTELEKALVIHNAFTAENCYATEEYNEYERKEAVKNKVYKENEGKSEEEKKALIAPEDTIGFDDMIIFTPLGLFRNNRAVCQGNSIALAAVYNAIGIETTFCESNAIKHIWNCVKINGKWYHLDETWNDATVYESGDGTLKYDENGKITNDISDGCFYKYFLLPTQSMEGTAVMENDKLKYTNHATEEYWRYSGGSSECTDNTYESGYMFNIGNRYGKMYVDDGKIRIKDSISLVSEKYVASNSHLDYYSCGIKTSGAVVTDFYDYESTDASGNKTALKAISIIANEDIKNAEMIYCTYSGGNITGKSEFAALLEMIPQGAKYGITFPNELPNNFKVMIWKDKIEPVCTAVEYK